MTRKQYVPASSYLLLILVCGAFSIAQDRPTAMRDLPSKEAIEARIQQLDQDNQADQESKDKARGFYDRAVRELVQIQSNQAAAQEFEFKIANAKNDLEKAQASRTQKQATAQKQVDPAANVTLSELEQGLRKRETTLKEATDTLARLDAEPKRRAARLEEIPKLLSEVRNQATELDKQLAAPENDAASAVAQASRLALRVQRQLLKGRVLSLEKERVFYDATNDLLQVERDIAAAAFQAAEVIANSWRDAANQQRKEETERQKIEARKAALSAKPPLQSLALEIEDLTKARDQLAKKIPAAEETLEKSRAKLNKVSTEFGRAKEKVAAVGLSRESGALLRRERGNLPDARKFKRDTKSRQDELRKTRFVEYDYQDKRLELADVNKAAIRLADQLDDEVTETIVADVCELLSHKKGYLEDLIRDSDKYAATLLQLNEAERQLIDVTEQYAGFIDERVLWMRSADPLGPADVGPSWDAANWLVKRENWVSLGTDLWPDSILVRMMHVVALLAFLVLAYFQRPLRRAITVAGSVVSRRGFYRFTPTKRVLFLTLAGTLMWPGIAAYVAFALSTNLAAGEFSWALGMALWVTAGVWFALEFVRQLARDEGLAERHLELPQGPLNCVRWAIRPMLTIGLPLLFVSMVMQFQTVRSVTDAPSLLESSALIDTDQVRSTSDDNRIRLLWATALGRAAFIAFLLVISFYLQRMFYAKAGVKHLLISNAPNRFVSTVRSVSVVAVVAMPFVLAALAWVGYYETAQTLALRLFQTGCLAVGLILLHHLFVRWVLMRRRRLAIEQFRQRRVTETDLPASQDLASIAASEKAAEEIDLSDVSHQTVNLMRTTVIVVGVICTWVVWVDVVPALSILTNFPIWPGVTEVSLAEVLLGAVILIVTYIASRNVPGLLELTLLNHLPVDAGARFATTTLCCYVIAASGVTLGAHAVGITWSSVQWLVAAMGIGLGFGLQEIFANFISGIILLFERPIRVGDIVTVTDTTGVVTRIRMRATTITDWDRKEYVVPNKDLVTGRLLNWTLSDRTNRIVIPIGVAYGTDTDQARKLLLAVANENHLVLEDPAPSATFEGFGDSTLNLTLRCYLPDFENRLPVISEIHTVIDQKFRQAEIEIAFPQQDLHIRTIQDPLKTVTERSQTELPYN